MPDKILLILKLICDFAANFFTKKKVILVSESADWVIKEECKNIKNFLDSQTGMKARISITPLGSKNKILHFFSVNTFINEDGIRYKGFFRIHPSNRKILTWFHISENDNFRLKYIPQLNNEVEIVHTASSNTKRKLLANGLKEEKMIIIPLGVDTKIFKPLEKNKDNKSLRKRLGIPEDKIIIGSFQKDGNGWEEGLEPKLIKGPDTFCDVVEKLAKNYPIHVLLTGPARGYVKKRLEKAGITYTHRNLSNYKDIVPYYQILDLYLICSREEGGPKALLESMATGIPLISTRVGMTPDVIKNGTDGFLANIEDVDTITKQTFLLLNNEELKAKMVKNARVKISNFDLQRIGHSFAEIYNKYSEKV